LLGADQVQLADTLKLQLCEITSNIDSTIQQRKALAPLKTSSAATASAILPSSQTQMIMENVATSLLSSLSPDQLFQPFETAHVSFTGRPLSSAIVHAELAVSAAGHLGLLAFFSLVVQPAAPNDNLSKFVLASKQLSFLNLQTEVEKVADEAMLSHGSKEEDMPDDVDRTPPDPSQRPRHTTALTTKLVSIASKPTEELCYYCNSPGLSCELERITDRRKKQSALVHQQEAKWAGWFYFDKAKQWAAHAAVLRRVGLC
jgi:hypothetical protein